jgi:hypothetical protein
LGRGVLDFRGTRFVRRRLRRFTVVRVSLVDVRVL